MEQNFNEPLFDLQLDHEAGAHFHESSKWAKFLSVIYFIAIGVVLLVLLFAATAMINAFQEYRPDFAGAGGILVAAVIIGLVLGLFTTFLLFRFATLTKQGIERRDQIIFNRGLQALKNYFMIYGVIAMLTLIFSIISGLTNLS
jgi:Ni/Fe-hydrogenase subunit HybB-like protein